jgi:hypothetical protein
MTELVKEKSYNLSEANIYYARVVLTSRPEAYHQRLPLPLPHTVREIISAALQQSVAMVFGSNHSWFKERRRQVG